MSDLQCIAKKSIGVHWSPLESILVHWQIVDDKTLKHKKSTNMKLVEWRQFTKRNAILGPPLVERLTLLAYPV